MTGHDFSDISDEEATPEATETTYPGLPGFGQSEAIDPELVGEHDISYSNDGGGQENSGDNELPLKYTLYLITLLLLVSLALIFNLHDEGCSNTGN